MERLIERAVGHQKLILQTLWFANESFGEWILPRTLRCSLLGTEFLRRFFLHVLPGGFVRIRHFGFLANRFRGALLPFCRELLAMLLESPPATTVESSSVWHCPRCGAAMVVVQRLSAAELSPCGYFDSS
mgnify:CR=1 FL=1